MMVKNENGEMMKVASNSKANAGLTTGIIGTALGGLSLLNGGANPISDILTGGTSTTSPALTERQYYNDTIGNLKDFFVYSQTMDKRICDLEQRVAVDEVSIAKNFEFMSATNAWQDKFVDEKFRYSDLLEQCRIEQATCKCIKGDVYASPSSLADPYVGRQIVLGSYVQEPFCGINTFSNCGCGYGIQ